MVLNRGVSLCVSLHMLEKGEDKINLLKLDIQLDGSLRCIGEYS